ncbi:hypothetical protein ACFY36_49045 [Actinoplanes sp. NPDC000266]
MRNANGREVGPIKAAAMSFRVALDSGCLRLARLAAFPHGSCGDTCELLGQFLIDSGLGEWRFSAGVRNHSLATHAWLEQDGLILDITADQFPEIDEPVLLTRDRVWHDQFSLIERHRTANLEYLLLLDSPADAEWTYHELCRRAGQ